MGLRDEYSRLSYHGMRAKHKSFKADFKMTLVKVHSGEIKVATNEGHGSEFTVTLPV